jgi:hypothetical protein
MGGVITVPTGALTIQGVYSAMANAIQQVHGARHMPPQAIFMHPRRWGFVQSLLDTRTVLCSLRFRRTRRTRRAS